MELSKDSVAPQALTMTILASVLAFYCYSRDPLDNIVRFTYLKTLRNRNQSVIKLSLISNHRRRRMI